MSICLCLAIATLPQHCLDALSYKKFWSFKYSWILNIHITSLIFQIIIFVSCSVKVISYFCRRALKPTSGLPTLNFDCCCSEMSNHMTPLESLSADSLYLPFEFFFNTGIFSPGLYVYVFYCTYQYN